VQRVLLVLGGVLGLLVVVFVVAVALWSGATLATDPTALAQVHLQPLAGSLEQASAFGADGKSIPLSVHGGRLTPLEAVSPGETVSVDVVIRRPGLLSWALGSVRHEALTFVAPVAHITDPWVTIPSGSPVTVSFDKAVTAVAYGTAGHLQRQAVAAGERTVSIGARSPAGAIEVEAAVAPWEKLSKPATVTWFPQSSSPVLVANPAPGATLTPAGKIRLTFSSTVSAALGSGVPRLSPATAGSWHEIDTHTLVFTPSGFGAPLGTQLHLQLPQPVSATGPSGADQRSTSQISWTVPVGSTARLQQLLAEQGYLPLSWDPTGPPVAATPAAQVAAAVNPPQGSFAWTYPGTPPELKALWTPGQANVITRGAVMKFENNNNIAVDGVAGATVWKALLTNALDGKVYGTPYSYVYVHRDIPQLLTLWSAGHIVLTSPGNTGIPSAPTQLGTFPVFEHIPVGTMSGTNPDGSKYDDPGIKWISYFNGGDALHTFNRASYGTPQSLGCVELPEAAAAQVYPYTPIGTLVTIEN
jgi:peptidoglycan hydrolase-like protein with peptidoglycan-binding domain